MASSDVEIVNMALSHLGVGKRITSLTEQSKEARVANLFYATARDATLRDFAWPFATKFADMELIETDPVTEWAYSYRYPSDCLEFRRILSGNRNDNRNSAVPYRIGQDDTGRLIYTDQTEAECEYTLRVTDVSFFSPDYVMAFSLKLAALMVSELSAGDPFQKQGKILQVYEYEMSKARANALNEEQPDVNQESDLITTRDGCSYDPFQTRFEPN